MYDLPPLPPPEPPPAVAPAPAPPPPAAYAYTPPPAGPAVYLSSEAIVRAPKYSLWLGGRLGLLAYAGGVYLDDPISGRVESIGNFVTPGLALEADVGARIDRRFIPYVALELGLVGAGRRFDGQSTRAGTSFFGLGFRYLAGDVDSVAFASDLSFGLRRLEVSNPSGRWAVTALEIFRLGLGAEIRLSNRLTLSPMLTLSGGSFTDVDGSIQFSPNQGDGAMGPSLQAPGGGSIPGQYATTYYAIVIGSGAHFDLFGKYSP